MTHRRRSRWRAAIAVLLGLAVVMGIVVGAPSAPRAEALTGSQFNAGNIISDAVFFNSATMSAASIQSFLNSHESGCRVSASSTTPCLKDYRQTTTSKAASAGRCAAYSGASNESAATIIYKVAQACRINPQVILVTLDKEQGLVSSTAPTSYMYRSAMGFGCPDTAACDSKYYGFFNQVYMASWQFREYAAEPDYWYSATGKHVGSSSILYSPAANCGSKTVNIQNQATVGLYIYTPYTPNASALANLSGTGDRCASYGNRNFWVKFNTWFGSSTQATPFGHIDSLTAGAGELDFTGWAFDGANPGRTINVQVDVTGPDGFVGSKLVPAMHPRPDVAKVYPSAGPNHGFGGSYAVTAAGSYQACFTALWAAGAVPLGCKTTTVTTSIDPQTPAKGSFDRADPQWVSPTTILVDGWAFDPNQAAKPLPVTIEAHSPSGAVKTTALTADLPRGDVGNAYPAAGPDHGFSAQIPISEYGRWSICATASGFPTGDATSNPTSLGCKTVDFGPGAPQGHYDSAALTSDGSSAKITVTGWAFDNANRAMETNVTFNVTLPGGSQSTYTTAASGTRTDVGAAFPGAGDSHGFSWSLPVSKAGAYSVCAYADAISLLGSTQTKLGCSSWTFGPSTPAGSFDSASFTTSDSGLGLAVAGWAFDKGLESASNNVDIWVTQPDGTQIGHRVAANAPRADVGRVYPAAGPAHGISTTIPLTSKKSGVYTTCVYSDSLPVFGSGHALLGCRSLTLKAAPLKGHYDGATVAGSAAAAKTTVSGWAFDGTIASLAVQVKVVATPTTGSATSTTVTANLARPDVARAYPAAGSAHGFSATVPTGASGTWNLCATAYGVSPVSSASLSLGCRTVTVP